LPPGRFWPPRRLRHRAGGAGPVARGRLGLGREALPEEIAAWDIDIRPDGMGLPVGPAMSGRAKSFSSPMLRLPRRFRRGGGPLAGAAGGFGTLDGEDPVKTVGSYWPYLSTVWDYVHRSMPYGAAQSLSDDEVYAITAYLLYLNNVVEDDFVLSNETFTEIVDAERGRVLHG
jgi:hypothetical protein